MCKLGDYGKMKYEKKKKEAAARKTQTTITVKEIKLRPKTDQHDFDVKLKDLELRGGCESRAHRNFDDVELRVVPETKFREQ